MAPYVATLGGRVTGVVVGHHAVHCESVIVTEEEVNPLHALFHHVAYKLAIFLNFYGQYLQI